MSVSVKFGFLGSDRIGGDHKERAQSAVKEGRLHKAGLGSRFMRGLGDLTKKVGLNVVRFFGPTSAIRGEAKLKLKIIDLFSDVVSYKEVRELRDKKLNEVTGHIKQIYEKDSPIPSSAREAARDALVIDGEDNLRTLMAGRKVKSLFDMS